MDQRERSWSGEPELLARCLPESGGNTVLFQTGAGFKAGWTTRLAVMPKTALSLSRTAGDPLAPVRRLAGLLTQRRDRGGTACTGVALLVGYELFHDSLPAGQGTALPDLHAWEVNASFTRTASDRWLLTCREGDAGELDRWIPAEDDDGWNPAALPPTPVRASTSLPRERYLKAVDRIRTHILDGDVYQANLTQRFETPFAGDPLELYGRLTRKTPAPRSALVGCKRFSMASVSPELFLAGRLGGPVRTGPIKGTRRRHSDPAADRAAAEELRRSEKDHAELLMIVDLMRNDLGRICIPGSIAVPELAGLVSYPAVHHLVGTVEGLLEPSSGPTDILAATFPGGSITGAPKERAVEILRELEPVERSFYTGSLFWFGDDGSFDSSILIRSVIVADGRARLGAGGGIVADSDAEAEWMESNDKARGPAEVLGFVPEEAR